MDLGAQAGGRVDWIEEGGLSFPEFGRRKEDEESQEEAENVISTRCFRFVCLIWSDCAPQVHSGSDKVRQASSREQ